MYFRGACRERLACGSACINILSWSCCCGWSIDFSNYVLRRSGVQNLPRFHTLMFTVPQPYCLLDANQLNVIPAYRRSICEYPCMLRENRRFLKLYKSELRRMILRQDYLDLEILKSAKPKWIIYHLYERYRRVSRIQVWSW